jgi:hypothetical protein
LKSRHFCGGKTGIVPELNLFRAGLGLEMVFESREAHYSAVIFRLAESAESWYIDAETAGRSLLPAAFG